MVLGLKQCPKDVLGGASPRSLVCRASVQFADVDRLIDVKGLDDDDWHFGEEDLGLTVFDDEILPVEARTFELEAGAIGKDEGGFLFGFEQILWR